ncbi:hypothetical protein [Streptomyces xantholiticus]|uniref:hypothetical protein n=1 Tax=Streptomyces xantholiticus TaxID=68285 RepID=UPI00167316BA|nr:hypothetical protein [Streptomyces xantholiticus]
MSDNGAFLRARRTSPHGRSPACWWRASSWTSLTAGLVASAAVTGALTGFDTVGTVAGVTVVPAAARYLFSTNADASWVAAVALLGGTASRPARISAFPGARTRHVHGRS